MKKLAFHSKTNEIIYVSHLRRKMGQESTATRNISITDLSDLF